MTKSTQFGKFEVQTKDSGDTLVWEHLPTGKTYEFDETGEFAPPSINTERLSTKSEPVYNVDHWGAVGDGSTNDTTAIQSAIDQANSDGGGTVFVPDGTYICNLVLKSNVTLDLDNNATLRLPDNINASVVSCATGASNIAVKGGIIDGNRPNTPDEYIHGIGFGSHQDTTEGANDFLIDDVKVVNCKRHGISMFQCEDGDVINCTLDDASGDDDLSVEESQDITVERCVSRNKTFSYDGRPASFEVEDNSKRVRFNNCYAVNGSAGTDTYVGFLFKTHSGAGNPPCKDIEANECYVLNSSYRAFEVVVANGTHERHAFNDCVAISPGQDAFRVDGGTSGLHGMSIDNCSAYDAGRAGLTAIGTVEGLEVDGFTADECSVAGITIGASGGEPLVSDSIVRDNGGDGISCTTFGTSISNCKVINNSGVGIVLPERGLLADSIVKNSGGTTGVKINGDNAKVRDCDIYDDQGTKTQDHAIFISSGLTDASIHDTFIGDGATRSLKDNGADRTLIRDCEIPGATFLSGTNTRLYDNLEHDDYVSSPPFSSPSAGDWYYDDGTNTGTGTRGRRVYDGTSWVDAWTL